jgi:hypothetical protein
MCTNDMPVVQCDKRVSGEGQCSSDGVSLIQMTLASRICISVSLNYTVLNPQKTKEQIELNKSDNILVSLMEIPNNTSILEWSLAYSSIFTHM